jgi:hypothetical protein
MHGPGTTNDTEGHPDYEEAFSAALEAAGAGWQEIPADGAWRSFSHEGTNYSAKLHPEPEKGGAWKDWSAGIVTDWKPSGATRVHLTDEQRQANAEKAAVRKAKAEAAFERAVKLWKTAPKADGDHQYLVKKGLRGHTTGILQDGNDLVIPMFNIRSGEFQTYQRIKPDGFKLFPEFLKVFEAVAVPLRTALDLPRGKKRQKASFTAIHLRWARW